MTNTSINRKNRCVNYAGFTVVFGWQRCKWWEDFLRSDTPPSDKLRGRGDQLFLPSPPWLPLNHSHFHTLYVSQWAGGKRRTGVAIWESLFCLSSSLSLKKPLLSHFFSLWNSLSSFSLSSTSHISDWLTVIFCRNKVTLLSFLAFSVCVILICPRCEIPRWWIFKVNQSADKLLWSPARRNIFGGDFHAADIPEYWI